MVARAGAALAFAAWTLGLLRWGPVYAEPFLDVRALQAVPWLLGLSVLAALASPASTGPRPWRRVALAAALAGAVLAGLVAARGPVGLAGEIVADDGRRHALATGP